MWELIKDFLFDKTAAKGYIRGALIGLGAAIATGQLESIVPAGWGPALMGLGAFIRSTTPLTPAEAKEQKKSAELQRELAKKAAKGL